MLRHNIFFFDQRRAASVASGRRAVGGAARRARALGPHAARVPPRPAAPPRGRGDRVQPSQVGTSHCSVYTTRRYIGEMWEIAKIVNGEVSYVGKNYHVNI